VTDGAPRDLGDALHAGFSDRESYAKARGEESIRALAISQIPRTNVRCLAFVDQESSLELVELVSSIKDMLVDLQPGIIFTHPYEGGHPDHDATSFAAHAAIALLPKDRKQSALLYEFTSYHAGTGTTDPTDFLNPGTDVITVSLCQEERGRKLEMIVCYQTQRETLRGFPIEMERFRPAPKCYFSQPPHSGRLHYENYDWKMCGDRWRNLAQDALRDLGLEEPL
jgi:LmbE family N-acetylglucosaminyl deacetylase